MSVVKDNASGPEEQDDTMKDVSLSDSEAPSAAAAASRNDSSIDQDNLTKQHIKQDSTDSYNTISSSSSSSSSLQYAEASSGDVNAQTEQVPLDDTPAAPAEGEKEPSSSSRPTSLDNQFSSISLATRSKRTSMASHTSNDEEKGDIIDDAPLASSSVDATTLKQDDDTSSTHTSPPKRVSLAHPETPSSPTAHDSDSLLRKQLDAHPLPDQHQQQQQEGSHDDQRWRDSIADGTTASVMDTVALSDSRPSSQVFSPLANDFSSSSFQEVEIPLDENPAPPIASTSASTALPSSIKVEDSNTNAKHLSANDNKNGTDMARSVTRQSTASSTHNYDLIQQRAETHHQDLEGHPRRHRRTLRGSEDLRANFDKLREEMNTPAPESPTHSSPANGSGAPHDLQHQQQIDWDFWGEVMSDYEGIAKKRPRDLSKAIQNGIPPALRGMMWQLMSASKDPELEATYSQLLRLPSTHEKAIIRDLNRTFPSHEYFHDKAGVGQNNLLNIMKAYSLYDDEVGYCQGMAFVVGPLLLNMPDEEAFCVLVRLMKSYDLRSQYIPDMPGLQLRLYQFDRLLEKLLPAVFLHLLRQGIKSSMYASQWFLTLLAYRFPLELVCSVFDLIFAEGVEAIFRFALAVMKKNEEKIVQMEFEQVLEFLKTGLFEEYKHQMEEGTSDNENPTYSVQTFVKEALQVKITPMMLDQYTSEWTEMCRQQNAQSAEVEQLRAINKKLSHQVRHLEASLAQINQEHCELVKQVVATRLEKEELEDELVRVKMALAQESLLREEGRGSIASRGSYASYTSSSAPYSPHEERRDSQLSIPK